MTKEHELSRILAIRAARNGKCTTYLDRSLKVRMSHDFTGVFIEKIIYKDETIRIENEKGEVVQSEAPRKLRNPTNGKPRKSIQQ